MSALNHVLKQLYQNYAVVLPPARQNELDEANAFFKKHKGCDLPSDYLEFLAATDGMAWNGLQLYSLSERLNETETVKYFGVMQVNLKSENPALKNVVVVGSFLEELIVYHPKKKEYQVWDRFTYTPIYAFSEFVDVLSFYARGLLEK